MSAGNNKMDIALFGTSADPPTIGHQGILQWLSGRYDVVVVWCRIIPSSPIAVPCTID